MAKLIMLSGLPASGKSTKAQELIRSMGNAVRVNKDLIRTMLHFDKWTGVNEGLTRDAERSIAFDFLMSEMNVIVDDTNLGQSHLDYWKGVAKETNSKFEHINIDTRYNICIERDSRREKQVGRDVITQMAMQYGLIEAPDASHGYVLCDLDGTLADIRHRLHFVKSRDAEEVMSATELRKKDWKGFFDNIPGDSLKEDVAGRVHDLWAKGHPVVLISARPENYRKETVEWLSKHGIMPLGQWKGKQVNGLFDRTDFEYLTLIMRRANDKRPDTEVKQGILDTYFKDTKHLIYRIFDDRPSVIRMWESNDLEVEDVGQGVEF